MSSLDDHCIITKYELTEKEKQLKKAFFNPGKKIEADKSQKKERNISNNLPNGNQKNPAVPDEFLNKIIKENVDPIINKNLKYLSGSAAGAQEAFLPLNIVYNQNRILERNVDILQETQRSLKDFFIYNLQHSDKKQFKVQHGKSDSFETKKFLLEIIKPLYQNIEGIKSQINNLNSNNRNNLENAGNDKEEVLMMQKNLKNSTAKVEKSINLVEQQANQSKKDNELYKLIDEIKGSINCVHKEMNKLETDVNENFKKMYEETQKKNMMEMLSLKNSGNKRNFNSCANANNNFSNFNFNNLNNNNGYNDNNHNLNFDLLKNSNEDEGSIDYAEFKKSLCDINLRTQEIKNEYDISKAKINFVHKFEKAEKIDFSYDIDFKDPFSFNSFTTNDDSLIAKEKRVKCKSNTKKYATVKSKYLNINDKNNKQNKANDKLKEPEEENYDTTDNEIFQKNKNTRDKKSNVFLDNLNKSMDSKTNVGNKIEKVESSAAKKQNVNQSTNYTLNSPSSGANNNTNSLIKSINNNNIGLNTYKNKKAINIINEEAHEENELDKKKRNNEFLENAKSEFDSKKNQNSTDLLGKKGLKDILMQKPNLDEFNTSKQKLLKDLVTKVLIEKIIVDKNKKAAKAGLVIAPATNEELNFFLREKEFSGKYGTGKFLDLDLDQKNAREITEKCVKEKIKTLLNKKKLRNLISGADKDNFEKQRSKINENKQDEENLDVIKSLENKLFEKLNKENSERDNFLNENFKFILQRLNEMEKNMGASINKTDRKTNVLKTLENENNNEKLSESQYIEIDKSSGNKKAKNYDEMVDIITEKIKSNMHITINLNTDGKNLTANNNNNNKNNINDNSNVNLNENENNYNSQLSNDQNNQTTKNENVFDDKKNFKYIESNKNPMGYTHPFADRNKILKMLDSTNYFHRKESLIHNIPPPHTINFNEFDVSSESCLTDTKRSEINVDFNKTNDKNTNNDLYTGTNQNLLYYTNIDNKIPNFQVTGKYAEDQLGYVNSLNINKSERKNNNYNDENNFRNEKLLLEANILAAELKRQKNFNNLARVASRDESLSEGQVATVTGIPNESELESFYAKSQLNLDEDELNDLNARIAQNKEKLEALNKRNLNIAKNHGLNLNDLKNINMDLEVTLEKYKTNNINNNNIKADNQNFNNNYYTVNDEYEDSSSNRYNISNSTENIDNNNENYPELQNPKKMNLEELNQQQLNNEVRKNNFNEFNNNKENDDKKNLNSMGLIEEKIKFLKANNLYDSEEQANFQKTFQNVLKKNNVLNNNSNNTSQASNFNNILSSFNNNNNNINNNLSGSLASSGKLRLGSARHNFLSSNNVNNNHVFQSFGGNILNVNNNNQISNRSNNNHYGNPFSQQQINKNFVANNFNNNNYNYNGVNSPQSNISSNVNSGRIANESLNMSNQINLENSNNFYNASNNLNEKFYYGYNNTISENHTESNNESAIERGGNENHDIDDNNYKFYKTDESSLDIHN